SPKGAASRARFRGAWPRGRSPRARRLRSRPRLSRRTPAFPAGLSRGEPGETMLMEDVARRALVTAIVVGAVVVLALALWKLKLLLVLLFLAFTLAAAMRPSVEALARRRVPRGVGILLHYAVLGALLACSSGPSSRGRSTRSRRRSG